MYSPFLDQINAVYPLKERDIGEFRSFRIMGMSFQASAWDAQGLGAVSFITGSAPLGLMSMSSLIITPDVLDMPLFAFDRMKLLGKDNLMVESYNTLLIPRSFPHLAALKASCQDLSDYVPKPYWYDDYLLPETCLKQGKKSVSARFDRLGSQCVQAFLQDCDWAPVCGPAEKKPINSNFVNRMVTEGGVSTNLFLKAWGEEKGGRFVREVAFGVR